MTDEVLNGLFKHLRGSFLLQQAISSGGMAVVFGIAMLAFLYLTEERDRARQNEINRLNDQWEQRLTLVENYVNNVGAATGAWGKLINEHSLTIDTLEYDVKNVRIQIDTVVKLVTENGRKIESHAAAGTPVTEDLEARVRRIEGALPPAWPVQ